MTLPTFPLFRTCLLLLGILLVAGCDTAEGPSLYDPIEKGTYQPPRPDPVLTAITPAPGQALAGVTELVLNGQNFTPSADSTFVYFNGARQPVLEVTPTAIRMRAPNMPVSGLKVRVSVLRAENFSPTLEYALLPAVERLGDQALTAVPVGLTSDDAGNAYLSFLLDGAGAGIRKSTPDGTYSQYATPTSSTYPGLAYSATTGLLGVRNVRAVFRIAEGASATGTTFFVFPNAALRLRALDIDEAGNIWTGGAGVSSLFRITPAGTSTEVALPGGSGSVLAIEARNDFVYVSVVSADAAPVNRIYRYALNGSSVGAAQEVVNVSAMYPLVQVTALAFTSSGDLFMGTSRVNSASSQENVTPILELPSGGTLGELYDGLLVGDVVGLAWGNGTFLYAAGPKIVADGKSTTTLGDLIRINTLRIGER